MKMRSQRTDQLPSHWGEDGKSSDRAATTQPVIDHKSALLTTSCAFMRDTEETYASCLHVSFVLLRTSCACLIDCFLNI